jgi:hypothetical protein
MKMADSKESKDALDIVAEAAVCVHGDFIDCGALKKISLVRCSDTT